MKEIVTHLHRLKDQLVLPSVCKSILERRYKNIGMTWETKERGSGL